MALHPNIMWAQRKDVLLITIPLTDSSKVNMKADDKLELSATAGGKEYHCSIPLFGAVVPEESNSSVKPRQIELKLKKKDETWWPRFTKDKVKSQHIQIDWNRWKDEDEADEAPVNDDFGMGGMGGMDFASMMGGMGGGGMGGMDMASMMGNMGQGGEGERDSDDEEDKSEMPPLEKTD
jgi:hypothetical protein